MSMFEPDKETLPREELEPLQLRRLRTQVERVSRNVPFYRKAFADRGIVLEDIRSLNDLKMLPFTEKQDLRDNYPFGLFAMPKENVIRIHASSGTTGKASVVGYTRRDLDVWANLAARALCSAGLTTRDTLHNAYGYGLFTGGLGMHYGAERLGMSTVPISGGATNRQVTLLRDFGATAICCTPSYALHLYDAGQQAGIDFHALPLKAGVFGAEPWTEGMRRDIETKMGIDALNVYGLSEVMGPGVAMECLEAKDGMHIFDDHFLPEIVDPATGQTLEPGQVGELVLTTLTKEAMPLIRYRTRDLTSLNYAYCRCGRTHVRMGRVFGRTDDMLIIRGVNVFPGQIESILLEHAAMSPHYQIIVRREGPLDTLEVQVEVNESLFSDEVKNLQRYEQDVSAKIKEFLGVSAQIKLVEAGTITRSEGKAKRVLDLRNL